MKLRKDASYAECNLSKLNKERRIDILRQIDQLTDRLTLKLDADGQRLLKELIFLFATSLILLIQNNRCPQMSSLRQGMSFVARKKVVQ